MSEVQSSVVADGQGMALRSLPMQYVMPSMRPWLSHVTAGYTPYALVIALRKVVREKPCRDRYSDRLG